MGLGICIVVLLLAVGLPLPSDPAVATRLYGGVCTQLALASTPPPDTPTGSLVALAIAPD